MSKRKKGKKNKKRVEVNQQTQSIEIPLTPKPYTSFDGVPIEQGAIAQMELAMSLPISIAGALMPDAHEGYGLPIGGVLATKGAIIPYAVGMDIGCRMALTVYETEADFLERYWDDLKRIIIENTRFGTDEFHEPHEHPVLEREEFKQIKFLKSLHKIAYRQFGTSGRGNHFVEFGHVNITMKDNPLGLEPGKYFGILSHSGSRHFGYEIAKHYSKIAEQKLNPQPKVRKLSWLELSTQEGHEYWLAMRLAGDYAKANHDFIHKRLAKVIGITPIAKVENHHNFAWKEKHFGQKLVVHRKGATPARKGALGIIPGNMVLPAYIVQGRGYEPSLDSASHGAGRIMSRNKAKQIFTRQMLDAELKKHKVELIGGGLDEAPMAYKNINDVIRAQRQIIDIIGTFLPRIVRME